MMISKFDMVRGLMSAPKSNGALSTILPWCNYFFRFSTRYLTKIFPYRTTSLSRVSLTR